MPSSRRFKRESESILKHEYADKSTFHETKEIVSRLREPLKIKAVAITSTDPEKQGHMIELSMNVSWGEIDQMRLEADTMVKNMIEIIEGPMGSKYMGKK